MKALSAAQTRLLHRCVSGYVHARAKEDRTITSLVVAGLAERIIVKGYPCVKITATGRAALKGSEMSLDFAIRCWNDNAFMPRGARKRLFDAALIHFVETPEFSGWAPTPEGIKAGLK